VMTRGPLRARRYHIERAECCPNLYFRWNSSVIEVLGRDSVEGVRIKTRHGGTELFPCSGIFPMIGGTAVANFAAGLVKLDAEFAIITDPDLRAGHEAIFAVGAARSGFAGDLINAASDGAVAAKAAGRALRDRIDVHNPKIGTGGG